MKQALLPCLILFICTGCYGDLFKVEKDPVVYKETTWNPIIEKFSSCSEIDNYILEHKENYGESVAMADSPGSSDQPYNNQVDGVFEGDLLQVTPSYFYFARPEMIEVIRREDFSNFKSIPTAYSSFRKLLIVDDKLIYLSSNSSYTTVQIFNVKNDYAKIYEKNFLGYPVDFRVIKNKLHIITKHFYSGNQANLDCSQIYRPNAEDGIGVITLVNQVSLGPHPFSSTTTGFMGQNDFFHMTAEELILFKSESSLPSHFRVVKLDSELPRLDQVQTYQGSIKDRWSVLAKDGKIIFASNLGDMNFIRQNKLFVFEKMRGLQYELASESAGFGFGENIQAVRYFMDKAYIVTFRQTDPLFVFDLKDTRKIELLNHLESPGFSTQLRELNSGILFGLGVAESLKSIKVSLFDVFDPLHPRETQSLIWGESKQSSSYSEALTEPKALFISQEKNRIIFPATIMDDYGMNHIMPFSGAVILDFHDRQIKEAGRITHVSMHDENCSNDIQRAFQAQGEIYSFSSSGAMRSSAENFTTIGEVRFKKLQVDCWYY
jgi:uncharacterized secreted protein with C-terminal beta-propeller domain